MAHKGNGNGNGNRKPPGAPKKKNANSPSSWATLNEIGGASPRRTSVARRLNFNKNNSPSSWATLRPFIESANSTNKKPTSSRSSPSFSNNLNRMRISPKGAPTKGKRPRSRGSTSAARKLFNSPTKNNKKSQKKQRRPGKEPKTNLTNNSNSANSK